jgi:hypothetical protein
MVLVQLSVVEQRLDAVRAGHIVTLSWEYLIAESCVDPCDSLSVGCVVARTCVPQTCHRVFDAASCSARQTFRSCDEP